MITLYNPAINSAYGQDLKPTSLSLTGECILPDATMCKVTEELNGQYELQMTYLPNGINAEHIRADAILGVSVPLRSSIGENYFRIYRVTKDIRGHINVYARHLSSDLSYIAVGNANLSAITITDFSGYVGVLRSKATDNIPFNFENNVTGNSRKMPFWSSVSANAYLGGGGMKDPDMTALQLFGGEYAFDKFDISLNTRRGIDRDYELHYGVSISALTVDDDIDNVYTAFVLYWSGKLNDTDVRIYGDPASTQYASMFPYRRTQMVDWSNSLQYETEPSQATVQSDLTAAAQSYAAKYGYDPISTISVDVVAAGIDEIYLGDTIRVIYDRYGLNIDRRIKVVAYEWDVLLSRYNRVTLGAIKETLASIIAKR